MEAAMVGWWPWFGSAVASTIFLWSMVQNHIPDTLRLNLPALAAKLTAYFNPYLQITISENGTERWKRSELFLAIEAYLSDACARRARRLKAELGKDSKNIQVSVDDHEGVTDDFSGATLWWYTSKQTPKANVISFYPGEDIDCSTDLTGKRRKDKKASGDKDSDGNDKPKLPMEPEKDDETKVTLSGLLNFIDGLWSACGGERIIIFTTNYKEELDPALIRRGRMDKHIEMSYCRFESFKVLTKNYLDVIEHELFGEIQQLLEETDMSPADVAENLMPMSKKKKRDPDVCLAGLIEALKQAKEDAAVAKAKEEEDAKEAEAKKAKEKQEAEVNKAKEKEEAQVKKAKEKDEGKDKTSEEANGDNMQADKIQE